MSETQLALVTQGNLSVQGGGSDSSFFQGLIYTEGDFFAEDVTLVGAFAANRGAGNSIDPGSRIELHNTAVVSFPEYGTFDLEAVPLMIWGENHKESQGGREVLTLLEVDEQDISVLEDAVTSRRTQWGGEGIKGTETPYAVFQRRVDVDQILSVTRGRRVIVEDGQLVSEWTVLTPEEIRDVLGIIEPSGVSMDSSFYDLSGHQLLRFSTKKYSLSFLCSLVWSFE